MEIGSKLAALVQLPSQHVLDVYIEGPCGIHVLVTDEVVQNMKDESMYTVELLPGKFQLIWTQKFFISRIIVSKFFLCMFLQNNRVTDIDFC